MIYIEAVLLVGLLFFGGYCAITDLQHGIVQNKIIVLGLVSGFFIHAGLLLVGEGPYYPYWLINMVIADIFAFGMFVVKMWAAGDAKLFMLLYIFVPPRLLDAETLAHSVTPYIYIFIPALIWIVADSVVRIIKKEKRKHQQFSLKSFLVGFLQIISETTAFFCLASVTIPGFMSHQEVLFATIMLIYAYLCGTLSVMKKWYAVCAHIFIILVMWILGRWNFSFPSWENYIIIFFVIVLQRFCSMFNYQHIPTEKVKAGMIPAAETIILFQKSRVHSLPCDLSEELTAKINQEETMAIRRWGKTVNGEANIWIVRKVPFAIMIFIGFVGWIVARILWR